MKKKPQTYKGNVNCITCGIEFPLETTDKNLLTKNTLNCFACHMNFGSVKPKPKKRLVSRYEDYEE